MSIIHVQDLTKVYRIVEKEPGIAGSFKALFRPRYKDILAIDRLHFSLEVGMFLPVSLPTCFRIFGD